MLTIDSIKEIVSRIGKKYNIKSAYLFGSYARGEASEDSDVDIIIDRGEIKTFDDFADFRHELVNALGTDVDLITTVSVKPNFFNLIKNDRILLYGV